MSEITRNKITAIEAIREHLMSPRHRPHLTETQIDIKMRIDSAHAMLLEWRSPFEIAPLIASRFNVSENQAYTDIRDAKKLYGDLHKSSKTAERYIASQMALATFKKADEIDDIKGMNTATANYYKMHGTDKDDVDMPDWDKLSSKPMAIILDEWSEKIMAAIGSHGGRVNLDELINEFDIDDIDHEEIRTPGEDPEA